MTLNLKTVQELSGVVTYVSGGGAVASGGVYEVKFGEYEKVSEALPVLDERAYTVLPNIVYQPKTIISGNVVAVQLQKIAVEALSGVASSGLWVPCLSGDLSVISGEIKVIADCF